MNMQPRYFETVMVALLFFSPINIACLATLYWELVRNRSRGRHSRLAALGAGMILFATLLFISGMISVDAFSSLFRGISRFTLEKCIIASWTITAAVGMGIMLRAATIDRPPVSDPASPHTEP